MFFNTNDINRVLAEIEKCSNPVIICHKSPDGDAIGSSLGLRRILENKGKHATVVVPDTYPEVFAYLQGEVLDYSLESEVSIRRIEEADIIFCLDFNDLKRIGGLTPYIQEHKAVKVMIDHHPYPSNEFDILLSSTTTGSTAELVFHLIQDLDEHHLIDRVAATALLTGIITDTGSFKYGTSAVTFSVASSLVGAGAPSEDIQKAIFDQNSLSRLRLNGFAISEKLALHYEGKLAIVWLEEEELKRFDFKRGDTEGLVNQALSIKGVEVAVLITPRDGETRLSFRSKNDVKVNGIASSHFSGGGHERAAGGTSMLPVKQCADEVIEIMVKYV